MDLTNLLKYQDVDAKLFDKALRKLKHPNRSKKLQDFVE